MECWYVNAGGAAGTSFSLALGSRVPRKIPVKNPDASEEFRLFEGEANLYVWCTWRLETEELVLGSSDQDTDVAAECIRKIAGRTLERITVSAAAGDLILGFGDQTLRVFCDHVEPDPSYDTNWELFFDGRVLVIGPGLAMSEEIQSRV
jgi:hypothetical protein